MPKCYNQRCTFKTAKETLMQCHVGCNSIHKSINNGFNHGFNCSSFRKQSIASLMSYDVMC